MKLQNRRILFTAPRQYARKLSSLLIDAGARPIWLPAIEITSLPPAELYTLDRTLERLDAYSHIAFTSKNGITSVLERLAHQFPDVDDLVEYIERSNVMLCALGADGEELKKFNLTAHVQPTDASTMGLVKELDKMEDLKGSRILCPVPSVRGGLTEPVIIPRFLNALKSGGADPIRLDAYVTQPGCPPEHCIAERSLLQNGDIAAIVFTSSAEAQGLIQSVGSLEMLQDMIDRRSVLLAAHGPFTAAGVKGCLGLDVPCVSQNYKSFEGVVRALETSLCSSPD